MNFKLEIELSILNLLNSDISSDIISKETKLDISEVDRIRKDGISTFELSFKKVWALYICSVNNKLNKKYIDAQNKKGTYSSVNVDIPLRKIYISQHEYGLFSIGIWKEKNVSYNAYIDKDKLEKISMVNNVLINNSNDIFHIQPYSDSFLCGYYGGSPINLKDFLTKYSNIEAKEIENIVYNKSIVCYDFYEDKIEGYDNILTEVKDNIEREFLSLHKYKGKLIVKLLNNSSRKNYKKSLDEYIDKIYSICGILEREYGINTMLRQIKYIKCRNSKETEIYIEDKSRMNSDRYDFVLVFDKFEIWLKTDIYSDNIFMEKEIKNFLNDLGIKLNY